MKTDEDVAEITGMIHPRVLTLLQKNGLVAVDGIHVEGPVPFTSSPLGTALVHDMIRSGQKYGIIQALRTVLEELSACLQ